jgi:CBS domain-containing protein
MNAVAGRRCGLPAPPTTKEHPLNENMTAGDLCNRIVTVADRRMSVVQAAELMRERHVGCLIVTDTTGSGGLVVGVLTDRDIVTAVVAKGLDPAMLLVEDVMTADVVTALEHETVMDMLATMRRKGLRRLPVTTPEGLLLGLMTLDDLIEVVAEQLRTAVMAIGAEQLRERRVRP